MPPSIVIAVILLAINVAMAALNLFIGDGGFLGLVVPVLLLLGVLKGSEGTRMIIIGLSVLGIAIALVGLFAAAMVEPLMMIAMGWGVLTNVVVIVALTRPAAQEWMVKKSLGADDL